MHRRADPVPPCRSAVGMHWALSLVLLIALAGGCTTAPPPPSPAPPAPALVDTIVLLPERDGRATAVTVTQGSSQAVLDRPYAAATAAAGGGGVRPSQSSAADVQARFGAALAAQPPRPASFVLYFVEGRDTLTDESKAVVERVFAEIAARPAPDIAVIGHTDSVGTAAANDVLSLQRAETIRRELLQSGIVPQNVQASGRGERELLVPSADNVAEPRNRRVEIIVR